MSQDLLQELDYFNQHREEWCKDHLGKFVVVVRGNELVGFYDTFRYGYHAGIKAVAAGKDGAKVFDPFLVKLVQYEDEPYYIF